MSAAAGWVGGLPAAAAAPPACCRCTPLRRRACPHLSTPRPPVRSKERKELERARKARKHKNFNLIQEVVQLWEEARRQDITADKRSKLVTAIMGKIQGRVAELAGSHSASRVIQTCAKHGTPAGAAAGAGSRRPGLEAAGRGCTADVTLALCGSTDCNSTSSFPLTSVVVQVALKFTFCSATCAERAVILKELEPKLLELSKSP